ncbi:hypothetical protein ACTL6P_23850 [Endozoicomonas acroporae]|uniref:hypothetical protein n=1 Tax=Endozoicomonas acroporae TaxID=1701104 RepID=UPI000C77A64E|nr:hypothetical protein [Endozoicomonas acroporae]
MGTDIHAYAEFRNNVGQWEEIPDYKPFSDRDYDVFSLFAGVRFRNDYVGQFVSWGNGGIWTGRRVTPYPIDQPRGLPNDVSPSVKARSDWESDGHSHSWLSVEELTSYNYDKPLRDRNIEAAHVPEEFVNRTVREALGEGYFQDLAQLQKSKAERIVFWFDS